MRVALWLSILGTPLLGAVSMGCGGRLADQNAAAAPAVSEDAAVDASPP